MTEFSRTVSLQTQENKHFYQFSFKESAGMHNVIKYANQELGRSQKLSWIVIFK